MTNPTRDTSFAPRVAVTGISNEDSLPVPSRQAAIPRTTEASDVCGAGADLVELVAHRARLRAQAGLTRTLRPREANSGLIDLAGNDYLGLSVHPDITEAAIGALAEYGLGATGSRLVQGSTVEHHTLEQELASLMGWPSALVYSSGYLANLGVVRGLAGPNALLVVDSHAHASLIDGCRLSGAETVLIAHADPHALANVLQTRGSRRAVVVTESVFSVDGDLAPLVELHAVSRAAGATLVIDDAHALGVLGKHGAGAVTAIGLAGQPDVVVTATLSKALGAAGGVVAAHSAVIDHLIDTSRTFIYDTALPPAVAAGARAALNCVRDSDVGRSTIERRAQMAATVLAQVGNVVPPAAGVVSVATNNAKTALAWAAACREAGVAVGCFRPPSTPDNRSRLRITINAALPEHQFAAALATIVACAP